MIGRVYFIHGQKGRYVLKLFRPFHSESALRSVEIIRYLAANGYPVVSLLPTLEGASYGTVETPDGTSAAILYRHVEGTEPVIQEEVVAIGRQVGELHSMMQRYPGQLPQRGKTFYVDRYIALLKAKGYSPSRTRELDELGGRLWEEMAGLPAGFCHGDLHTGNMLRTGDGKYVLFDFDVAGEAYSLIDLATLGDATNFNHLDPGAYDETMRRFADLNRGYQQAVSASISDAEIAAIPYFIAIRHFEIIATIVTCQGLAEVSLPFLDEQYEWLLEWEKVCRTRS